jgi:hypothetical protein
LHFFANSCKCQQINTQPAKDTYPKSKNQPKTQRKESAKNINNKTTKLRPWESLFLEDWQNKAEN